MTFDFKEILLKWLQSKNIWAEKVSSYYEEYFNSSCGEGTCDFSECNVEIWFFERDDEKMKLYTYDGSLTSLIYELEQLD